jgi:hypothetical protein
MPIMLRESALFGGEVALANNDVLLEVVTPTANQEAIEFTSVDSPEYKAWDKAFRNRKTFDWNAFIYWVPPNVRGDRDWLLDARAAFHIHVIAQLTLGRGLFVERLLPKSSYDRVGPQINLAGQPLEQWDGLVATMTERTRVAVERFRIFYVERFLTRE